MLEGDGGSGVSPSPRARSPLPPHRRAPDSELRSLNRVVGKGSSPASSNARLNHPSLLYRCTVSAAEEGRWLGERRVHKALQEPPLQFAKLPQLLGRRRAPSACLCGGARPGSPSHRPGHPPAPSKSPQGSLGAPRPQPSSGPGSTGEPQPGRRDGSLRSPGIGPPERDTRVLTAHCFPIKQLTGKRMERPPPLWLPKSAETGKVTGTEIPFSLLPPQSQRRLQ